MQRSGCWLAAGLFIAGGFFAGAAPLAETLKQADPALLAKEARLRGNAERGAVLFHTSAASCVSCHGKGAQTRSMGPGMSDIGKVSDAYLVDALLRPSKAIRKGFQFTAVTTKAGAAHSGFLSVEDETSIVVGSIAAGGDDVRLKKSELASRADNPVSMMPNGLVNAFRDLGEFYDVLRYVMDVSGGKRVEVDSALLKPKDDSANLNHAAILKRIKRKDLEAGKALYEGDCASCHGLDGKKAALATARAFGTEEMKFGADPYSMFLTLTRGNGLMAPALHLSPRERYQVVQYIRQTFMKAKALDKTYLAGLPKGTEMGDLAGGSVERDFGPALASQLRRDVESALTVKLGEDVTISYDLHSMNQAGLWKGGFLNLEKTQHMRGRGEGVAEPKGTPIEALAGWAWGHEGGMDYPKDDLLARGPMPKKWLDYKGHYLHGDGLVLSYAIDERSVLELPELVPGTEVIAHTLKVGPGPELVLRGSGPIVGEGFRRDGDLIRIAASKRPQLVRLFRGASQTPEHPLTDPETLTKGGALRWPEVLTTTGYLGMEQGAYVLDSLNTPRSTPWNTWFRTSALDFFDDGRMVVTTHGGDVWIVSGVDEQLLELTWKRFAAGLYEPFGVKVVDGLIYVTCKDRLTRLHDLNGDGEADFYESFSADDDVSVNFHAFNFDLQTDDAGNFYYAKSGQYTDYKLPGAIIKVSPDGATRTVHATGLRTPNGMGIFPDGSVTVSDNQGNWMPASKVSRVKEGGFYGYVQTHTRPGMWAPDGGRIDAKKVEPPTTFDPPLIWMPQDVDNSCGGQLWVDDERWGPLSGRMLHTSFGKGWLYYMMVQEVGAISQAAIVKMPFDFRTGIMRARVNPKDGQVYATGLDGWNGNGRKGLLDKGIQRVRYTGKPWKGITDCVVEPDGYRLSFNFALDKEAAENPASWAVERWDYLWAHAYGSKMYLPGTDKPGKEPAVPQDIRLSRDGKSVKLFFDKVTPVNQVYIKMNLKTRAGEAFDNEIYWTINAVPGAGVKTSQTRPEER